MKQHRAPLVKIAWGFIILLVLGLAVLQAMPEKAIKGDSEDPIGLVMVQLQAEYMLGLANLLGTDQEIASQAVVLDVGTVGQRQRFMALMIAFGDNGAAKQSALKMHTELNEEGLELSQEQAKTQETLDQLADGAVLPSDSKSLEGSLGWFGRLVEADPAQRAVLDASAGKKVLYAGGIVGFIVVASGFGFVGLVIMLLRLLHRRVRSGMGKVAQHHGVYAEVFAWWLFVFTVLMSVAGILANMISEGNSVLEMVFSLVAFFGSLVVLLWARYRGITWDQIRTDIGWRCEAGVCKEVWMGVVGYAMMLPILAVGVCITMILMLFQGAFSGSADADPFGGTSGGAHPIVLEIAQGNFQLRVLLVILAAVVAPIVEETMFRGVLYRQLRTMFRNWAIVANVAVSVLITSFIFAAIHPQGWIAIPALMGIAIGMNLMREWRGSLLPSMLVHGISNGLVTTMMLIFLS
jgi:membrane protease YdiL (CAAX protease family)